MNTYNDAVAKTEVKLGFFDHTPAPAPRLMCEVERIAQIIGRTRRAVSYLVNDVAGRQEDSGFVCSASGEAYATTGVFTGHIKKQPRDEQRT